MLPRCSTLQSWNAANALVSNKSRANPFFCGALVWPHANLVGGKGASLRVLPETKQLQYLIVYTYLGVCGATPVFDSSDKFPNSSVLVFISSDRLALVFILGNS